MASKSRKAIPTTLYKLISLPALFIVLLTLTAFAQAPAITFFSPSRGPVGTLVTIGGTNLSSPTAITIGGANAIVISNTGTSIVAMVMTGATDGVISLSTAGGTATSTGSFTPVTSDIPNSLQGNKLVAEGTWQGSSVSISADGNTAIVGGTFGGTWVYARSGGIWGQGSSLEIAGTSGSTKVAISADGNTAIVGKPSADLKAWIMSWTSGLI